MTCKQRQSLLEASWIRNPWRSNPSGATRRVICSYRSRSRTQDNENGIKVVWSELPFRQKSSWVRTRRRCSVKECIRYPGSLIWIGTMACRVRKRIRRVKTLTIVWDSRLVMTDPVKQRDQTVVASRFVCRSKIRLMTSLREIPSTKGSTSKRRRLSSRARLDQCSARSLPG